MNDRTIPALLSCRCDSWTSPERWPLPDGADPEAMTLAEICESARLAGFSDAKPSGDMLDIGLHDGDPRRLESFQRSKLTVVGGTWLDNADRDVSIATRDDADD